MQGLPRRFEGAVTVQLPEPQQHLGRSRLNVECIQQLSRFRHGLTLQGVEQGRLLFSVESGLSCQSPEYTHMPQIEIDVLDAGFFQGLHHQPQDLHIALDARVPVQFGTDL